MQNSEKKTNISNTRQALWVFISLLATLAALALLWRYIWNSDWLSMDQVKTMLSVASSWHGELWLWPLVIAVFVLLLLLMFPLTMLVVLTGVLYGPWWGFCYATLGTLASAVVSYEVGRLTGQRALIRFGGKRLLNASRFLGDRGIRTMIIINLLPLAPFTLTNIMAGASHIRFWPYFIGSAIGIVPGIAVVNFAGSQLNALLQAANPASIAISMAILAFLTLLIILGPRWLKKYLRL